MAQVACEEALRGATLRATEVLVRQLEWKPQSEKRSSALVGQDGIGAAMGCGVATSVPEDQAGWYESLPDATSAVGHPVAYEVSETTRYRQPRSRNDTVGPEMTDHAAPRVNNQARE